MSAFTLIFDIETIPDLDSGRYLYGIDSALSNDDAMTALVKMREMEAGNSFMPYPLHKIACLSLLWFDEKDGLWLKSFSLQTMSEQEILSMFLRAIAKTPTLVTWNGAGFDLPVIMYRLAHHKMDAADLLGKSDNNRGSYLYRYSNKHIDLMDRFSFGAWSNKQKLDVVAGVCGFAGKGKMDGSQVLPAVLAGEWDKVTTYCESDVLNTWLVYLRWQLINRDKDPYYIEHLEQTTHSYIASITNQDGTLRHQDFLDGWRHFGR